MTSSHARPLPVVGAALRAAELPPVIDWLVEKQRDLEIQDPCYPGVLDGDWQPIVSEARALLDQHGYSIKDGSASTRPMTASIWRRPIRWFRR